MILLPKSVVFPKPLFPNFVTMWYCGDKSNHIPPLKIISYFWCKINDRRKSKVIMIEFLIHRVKRGSNIVYIPDFLVKYWTPQKAIDWYYALKHLFEFPSLERNRRYTMRFWKTYYNLLVNIKALLFENRVLLIILYYFIS